MSENITWEENAVHAASFGVLRDAQKRSLVKLSVRAGLCVLAFLILDFILSEILFASPTLYAWYTQSDTAAGLVEMFYYLVCMFVPFLVAYLRMKPEDRAYLTLFQKPISKPGAVCAVLAGSLVCLGANYLTNFLLMLLEDGGVMVDGGQYDTPTTPVGLVYTLLTVGLLPAFIEEFALRGVVMQPMRQQGDRFAICMSAFVFALMHGNLSQFVFAFIVGLAIGYFVIATGSIWVGVAIHMINNLSSVVLNYLLEIRPTAADTYYNIELSVTLVAGVLGFVLFFTLCPRNRLQKSGGVMSGGEMTATFLLTVPMIAAIIALVVKTIRLIHLEGF